MINLWKRITELFKPRDPWVKVDNTDLNNKLKDALDATPDLNGPWAKEGALAFRVGDGISDNPYVAGYSEPFEKANEWHAGYEHEMNKSKRVDEMFAKLHACKDFTVAGALNDYKIDEPIVYQSTEGTSSDGRVPGHQDRPDLLQHHGRRRRAADEAHYLRKEAEEEKARAKAKREIEMDVTYAIADKIGEWYPTSTPFDLEKHHRMARAILRIIDRSKYRS